MTAVTDFREAKDAFYRSSPESPLLSDQKRTFSGLNYYAEAPEFAFELVPEPFAEQELVEMQTSTGEAANYLRWARISIPLEGGAANLTVFRDPGSGALFLPFQDAGRGVETYGAGRYVEAEALADGRLHVDFNYAYNPYCAYNDGWSCPLPPSENRLNVPIRAGEKVFHTEE